MGTNNPVLAQLVERVAVVWFPFFRKKGLHPKEAILTGALPQNMFWADPARFLVRVRGTGYIALRLLILRYFVAGRN